MIKKIVLFCLMASLLSLPVSAISEAQKNAVSNNCISIKESLKTTQRMDARTRVYLGGKFETILTKFITPLNVKLVEKNISNPGLIENQSSFAEMKAMFSSDFIRYQQSLEELIGTDCEAEPEVFYNRLLVVRERRKLMGQDVARLKRLTTDNVRLVAELRSKL